jgi:hypothetical protein
MQSQYAIVKVHVETYTEGDQALMDKGFFPPELPARTQAEAEKI